VSRRIRLAILEIGWWHGAAARIVLRVISRLWPRGFASLALIAAVGLAASALPTSAVAGAVLVGAGDIGRCDSTRDQATARLIEGMVGTVFTTGDNAYPSGSAQQFVDCYDPSWGRFLGRTRPSPGNHDYATAGASGYFGYFGSRAGPDGRGYYAYDLGSWRVYSLNSEQLTDAQLAWLNTDLEANPSRCSLAYWHRPRFSSGYHGNDPSVRLFWRALYAAGAEVIVNGHDHDYERFAPQRPNGERDWMGTRQFVVGTGGAGLRRFSEIKPHSLARQASAHGVLKLRLRDGAYSWRFVSVDGSWTDTGSASCHGRP
jgi:hypothetical protein